MQEHWAGRIADHTGDVVRSHLRRLLNTDLARQRSYASSGLCPVVNSSVLMTIDAGSPLSTVGNAVLVQSALGLFLVARTGQNTFSALTAICTHQTCTITGFAGQNYVCPCHGSQFSTGGQVISGPAPTSLRQFATQFDGAILTIAA